MTLADRVLDVDFRLLDLFLELLERQRARMGARHRQQFPRRLVPSDHHHVGEAMVLAHDLPWQIDVVQGGGLAQGQHVEPQPIAGEIGMRRKDDVPPGLDRGDAILKKIAAVGDVA